MHAVDFVSSLKPASAGFFVELGAVLHVPRPILARD